MIVKNVVGLTPPVSDELESKRAYQTGKLTGNVLSGVWSIVEILGGCALATGSNIGTVLLEGITVGAASPIALPANAVLIVAGAGVATPGTFVWHNNVQNSIDTLQRFQSSSGGGVKGVSGAKSGPNGTFENAPYHGKTNRGKKNRAPIDGQNALDNSIPISPGTTTRRVSVSNGEIVILDETTPGVFHGHVRSWDELNPAMRSALQKAGLVNKKGKIINGN
ncbi:hypothetical protein WAZ07_21930 [Bacillus sp. FJAT-51639]|uniref:Uncharacterized protein n=1 Tax=Bacillus bruguierae TaxID=3127667 RepID=A0ABU8FPI3_9BACI